MMTRLATLSTLCIIAALSGCGSDAMTPAPVTTTPPPTTPTTTGTTPTAPATGAAGSTAIPTTPTMTTPTPSSMSGTTPASNPTPTTTPTAMMNPTPAAGAAGGGAMMPTMPAMPDPNTKVDPRGKCTINSNYPDDKACLLAPEPGTGIQVHVGPKDYANAADVQKYIFMPGEESSECWTFHTPNTEEIYYQTFELSGRAGTHHIINTMYNTPMTDGGFGVCADPGTGTNGNIIDNLPGASKAYMPRGVVAPENKNIGRKIPANAASQADMHYFNFTEKPILREFWMNIFTAKKEDIKESAQQIRAMGGISWTFAPIAPGTNMTYKYECPITGNGRILALLGHYHAHGKHFTASIRRGGGQVEKVFEMYDYQDPAQFEYDSVSKNPAFAANTAGAVSGMLEVKSGDTLLWDCHIINDSDTPLRYTNEVKTGEMCNLWGSSLGIPALNCVVP